MRKKFIFFFVFFFLLINFHIAQGIEKKDFIRLHVIANSDKEEDQEVKIKIKDSILEILTEIQENQSVDAGERYLQSNLESLQSYLEFILQKYGFEYQVKVSYSKSFFPTRKYNCLNLPAGEYKALKVILGEGKGTNWWCVIYPPLCISNNLEKKDNAANNSISVLKDKNNNKNQDSVARGEIIEKLKKGYIKTLEYLLH